MFSITNGIESFIQLKKTYFKDEYPILKPIRYYCD